GTSVKQKAERRPNFADFRLSASRLVVPRVSSAWLTPTDEGRVCRPTALGGGCLESLRGPLILTRHADRFQGAETDRRPPVSRSGDAAPALAALHDVLVLPRPAQAGEVPVQGAPAFQVIRHAVVMHGRGGEAVAGRVTAVRIDGLPAHGHRGVPQ